MAYTLQALIAPSGVFCADHLDGLRVVQLSENVEMIPLGDKVRERFGIEFLPLTDDGASVLSDGLLHVCCKLSGKGTLAYVEAEIFGDLGTQAFAMFRDGLPYEAPVVAKDAINQALRKIGVLRSSRLDEFDQVGLGKYRDTDGWLDD